MDTYFLIIRNYETMQCSIIGALSEEEEIELVNKIAAMQKDGIDCDKVSLNLDKSINEEINDLEGNFTLVPVNKLFESINFINIR